MYHNLKMYTLKADPDKIPTILSTLAASLFPVVPGVPVPP